VGRGGRGRYDEVAAAVAVSVGSLLALVGAIEALEDPVRIIIV
jgi:hypothetical protein